MSRPGFVLEVDERTPPLLITEGAGCRLERLPLGTKVVYPAESRAGVPDVAAAIGQALLSPLDQAPLGARLRPGMKLVIVFTDGSRPAPAQAGPDIRTTVLEQVLSMAADAGVDDVRLIAANGLRRAGTAEELRAVTGERVHRSFHSDGLIGPHDAEADNVVELGPGVRVNRAVAEADLVINIVVVTEPGHTGWSQLATGVTATGTAWAHLGGTDGVGGDVAAILDEHLEICQLEIVLDHPQYPSRLGFLGRREWEWTLRDRTNVIALRQVQGLAPQRVRRAMLDGAARYGVLAVHAGAVAPVAEQSRSLLVERLAVEVGPAADVLLAGPAPVSEHNRGAVMNPLLAAWDTLARSFGAHTGTPAVREGGAMILFHPLTPDFNARFHAASADFFAEVLPQAIDPVTIRAEHEERFLSDPWYVNLYRTQNAFHGTHPLQLWYEAQPAIAHCGDIIWVGADRASAERMGFRAASTLADALEIAAATVGRTPSITHLHTPPSLIAQVAS
jgi:hypothetical protein